MSTSETAPSPPTVAYSDLWDAFEWVAAGQLLDAAAYIDRRDGRIHYTSSDTPDDEALPTELDGDDYLRVPDKRELDLGQTLVFDFTRDVLPDDYDEVRAMFHRRGAYGRFRALVERRGRMQAWYDYRDAAERRAMTEWAESNGLRVKPLQTTRRGDCTRPLLFRRGPCSTYSSTKATVPRKPPPSRYPRCCCADLLRKLIRARPLLPYRAHAVRGAAGAGKCGAAAVANLNDREADGSRDARGVMP